MFKQTKTLVDINNLKPGDIILTRNENEEDNGSPGYWNHTSIYVEQGVVEAQAEPWDTVKFSEIEEFFSRYPKYEIFRWKDDTSAGKKAANFARTMIGKPYKMFASIFFRRRKGENCVSVVRKCYDEALGYDTGWRFPDDIAKDDRLTSVESISK